MKHFDVAIVGAGHAGAQAAIQLRQLGFAGSIGLIGAEPDPPYERPPLSKDYLAGDRPFERLLLRPPGFWSERGIDLLPETRIERVDSLARTLTASDRRRFAYSTLVWAAGGVPRRLGCAGEDLGGVHVLRSRADADSIRARLAETDSAVIVGGGYIGLEAAAVLRAVGKRVTLIEATDRLLSRVAGAEIGRFFEMEHRAAGVDIRLETTVERIEGDGGGVRAVRLKGDGTVESGLVIVGIGIAAAADPLLAAGAAGSDGVHVDASCRTSLAGIYAIGDCAAHVSRFAGGRRVRIESVQNAHDMAAAAAKAIVGRPQPYDAIPWFWSNQYDLRLQTVGLPQGHDEAVVRGGPEERSFSVVYLRGGRVIALDCVNATRDYAQGRRLVLDGARIAPGRLADASAPLKALAG